MACKNITPEFDAIKNAFDEATAWREAVTAEMQNRPMMTPEELLPILNEQGKFLEKSQAAPFVDNYEGFGRDVLSKPEYSVFAKPIEVTTEAANKVMSIGAIRDMANQLEQQFGISYTMVTEDQAVAATASLPQELQYRKGDKAFFLGGQVYLVTDYIDANSVLHEFVHPFVRAIARAGQKGAIDSMYSEVLASNPELIEQIKEKYNYLEEGSEYFKEEVIVTHLSNLVNLQALGNNLTPVQKTFIGKVLYAIKQLLRKAFGRKVSVESLSPTTSLSDLAKMIEAGTEFTFNTDIITDSDFAAYVRDHTQYFNDLRKLERAGELQASINRMFDVIQDTVNKVEKNKDYTLAAQLLRDEYDRSDLREILSSIRRYQTISGTPLGAAAQSIEFERAKMTAFINSMERLDVITLKINQKLQELSKDPDNKENLQAVFYMNNVINTLQNFINEYDQAFTLAGLTTNSAIYQLANKIQGNIKQSKVFTNKVYMAGTRDIIYDTLIPLKESIDQKYTELIDFLEKKNAPEKVIEARKREYEELKLNPEKIEALMKGELGDAHALNSFLEGYMNNQDPIVFGFAMYVKNNLTDVQTKAQLQANRYATEIEPLLKAAGFNPGNIAELGKRTTFVDLVGGRDKNKFNAYQAYTYLNPWKHYKKDIDEWNFKIEEAKKEAVDTKDYSKVTDLINQKRDWERKYMHTEYTDKYYAKYDILERDDIGKEARHRLDQIESEIRNINNAIASDYEQYEYMQELEVLHRRKKQLYSLLDERGKMKLGLDLEIAKRLQEFQKASKDMYDEIPLRGVFQNAFLNFAQSLVDKNIQPGSDEYNQHIDNWLKLNTRIRIKPTFYEQRAAIFDELATLKEEQKNLLRLANQPVVNDELTKLYEERSLLVSKYRDKDGQPASLEMTPEILEKVKVLEDKIKLAKEQLLTRSGLTKAEQSELNRLSEKKDNFLYGMSTEQPTQQEYARRRELIDKRIKRQSKNLSSEAEAALKREQEVYDRMLELYKNLENIQTNDPTDDYITVLNSYFSEFSDDVKQVFLNMGIKEFTLENIDIFDNIYFVEVLRNNNEDFKKWFDENHVEENFYNSQSGQSETKYKRTAAWSVTRPSSIDHYETTEIVNPDGSPRKILGVPIGKYYRYQVKQEPAAGFVTKKVTIREAIAAGDITKANWDGFNWLPKLDVRNQDGTPDTTYVENEFFKVKNSDPALYNLLIKLIDEHLALQENKAPEERLGLEIPRYEKSNLEALQSRNFIDAEGNEVKQNPISVFMNKVRAFWKGRADDFQRGFNAEEQKQFVNTDLFDDRISNIPMTGKYRLDLVDTSLDILTGTMRYMLSLEKNQKLREMSPTARALQEVLRDPVNAAKETNTYSKRAMLNRSLEKQITKKGQTIRSKAIDNFIEREFEGKNQTGMLANNKWVTNLSNFMLHSSALGYFALNIPSAIKNSMGARIQGVIEGAAGRFYNNRDFAKGTVWANKTMAEVSFQIYKYGPKSLNVQLTELFDPTSGFYAEGDDMKFGENLTRTFKKDAVEIGSLLTNTRKWTELNAAYSIFGAMMYSQKVPQIVDGETRMIPYIEAWEIVDGQAKLKEGVDPSWGQGGANFKIYRNKIQAVGNNLNGAFGKFDYSEADRYLLYRQVMFLKRWFIRMFMNRFQFRGNLLDPKARYDAGLNDTYMGFYIEALRTMKEGIATGGKSFSAMTKEQKQAFMRIIMDAAILIAMTMMISMLFGFDADDDEKYEKLRKKSGSLPFNFLGIVKTADDPEHPFNMGGYISNNLLALTLQTRQEQLNWIPLPKMGLSAYASYLNFQSLAVTSTIEAYVKILSQSINLLTGDESAYYKRAAGPYEHQQQGGSKAENYFLKMFGFTGSTTDPVKATKDFISTLNRKGEG
jgi:hypothetical protein